MRTSLVLAFALACTPADDGPADVDLSAGGPGDPGPAVLADGTVVFAAVDDGPGWRGPGGPAVAFDEADLDSSCAFLQGGEQEFWHHNLVVPYRGHLLLPWSPEFGTGGLSLFDVSDPCAPEKVGEGWSDQMRETHAIGTVTLPEGDPNAGDWAVVNMFGQLAESGIQFWDLSDVAAPEAVSELGLEGVFYPDSYNAISLSVFWQYPYVYVAAASNGVFVVDATDPRAPTTIAHFTFPNGLRAGGVFALGNLLLVTSAEETQAAVLDVSDPANPQLLPGSPFTTYDVNDEPREAYHGNLVGHLALFARKDGGGGPIVYDLLDPTRPAYVAELRTGGSGGYVFYDEGFLFTGDSDAAHITDARDWSSLVLHADADLGGDLDTFTPYGNVAILAVDDLKIPDGAVGEASAVYRWAREPDTTPIEIMSFGGVLAVEPRDGATGVPVTSRIGVGFHEFVEPATVFPGSIRLWDADGAPVPGWANAQEATVSFTPKAPLRAGAAYTIEVLAGGVADINGNALATTVTTTFTTAE